MFEFWLWILKGEGGEVLIRLNLIRIEQSKAKQNKTEHFVKVSEYVKSVSEDDRERVSE